MANNDGTFDKLIELGADIQNRDRRLFGPIHAACMVGNIRMLKTLIDRGADVNDVIEEAGTCPLSECQDPDCIRLLLENGADMHYEGHSTQ